MSETVVRIRVRRLGRGLVPWLALSAACAVAVGCGDTAGGVDRDTLDPEPVRSSRVEPGPAPAIDPAPAIEPPPMQVMPEPMPVMPGADVPGPTTAVEVRDLAALLPADSELVGVGIDAEGARLYVLDARRGVYELDARRGVYELDDERAELVFDLQASTVVDSDGNGMDVPGELTDLAVYDQGEGVSFVVTADNDGFLANPRNQVLSSFFCYEPGFEGLGTVPLEEDVPLSVSQEMRLQGIAVLERTEAIALDPWTGEIYAQPRTLRVEDRAVLGSELFRFASTGGSGPLAVRGLSDPAFAAGGMLVDTDSGLLLGSGSDLYFAPDLSGAMRRVAVLDAHVTGLALDRVRGEVLVLDGPGRRLLVLDHSALR